jgi:hypothetical protein
MNRPLNRPLTRSAAAAVLLMSFALGSATPVLADCQPFQLEEALLKADSVFVGTVTGLSNGGRWATVAVDEVWAGPSLAPVVEVRGGAAGNSAAEDDRSFVGGARYFFAAYIVNGAITDNACSSTQEWDPALANLRPASARPPVAAPEPETGAPFDFASLMLPAAVVLVVGGLVFGAVRVLGRRA